MRTRIRAQIVVGGIFLGTLLGPAPTYAQLSCGSTGARGELNVPENETVTLDVPDNGIFHFTTVTVLGTLTFNRNTAFNPPAIILATGDVVVGPNGWIRANGVMGTPFTGGAGGPGGFDGGAPGIAGGDPGAGHGPGAGAPGIGELFGGNAGYGQPGQNTATQTTNGGVYGSPLLVPLVGGSGGGGNESASLGGGGGGGALLLCSPTSVTIGGVVDAMGGEGVGGTASGSGGAIRFLAPAVRGSGAVRVWGGGGGWGGHGRVRIDLIDRSGLALSIQPQSAASVGSLMTVFPSTVPRLDIVHVAGNNIAVGTASPLAFTLPFNAPATQSITVRATGFTGIVPISIAVTPDAGNRIIIDTQINADAAQPETTVTVDLPQNVTVRVHAWTR
jgi:hypothetical protein